MLVLYNTATRTKEPFSPEHSSVVSMYNCGPTVYHYAHIGNMRSYVFADILRRLLEYEGYEVKQIINITDVGHLVSEADEGEDKIEKGARREGKTVEEIVNFYTDAFFDDLKKLNIDPEHVFAFPRASQHIDEQIALIKRLEKKGFTYTTSDGVYFDTSKFAQYADFAQLDEEGISEGARVAVNPEKRNSTDFALWKFPAADEHRLQEWDSPWGRGFPGWHIECSAMAMAYLGETLDIHTGGIDHIPVHHTNEIAQSEGATGKQFARFWLHNEFVVVEEGKMAKSEQNFLRLETLKERGYHPLAYRFLVLQAHYRTPLTFNFDVLNAAQSALYNVVLAARDLASDASALPDRSYQEQFKKALEDDIHTPQALSVLFDLIKDESLPEGVKLATVLDFDKVLGLDLARLRKEIGKVPEDIQELARERQQAKEARDWDTADRIRTDIRKRGFEIRDTKQGSDIYSATLVR